MNGSATSAQEDIRPVVPLSSNSDWGMWAFLVLLAIGGVVLFNALNAGEDTAQAPNALRPMGEPTRRISSPSPLALPPRFNERVDPAPDRTRVTREAPRVPNLSVRAPVPPIVRPPVPPVALTPRPIPAPIAPSGSEQPVVVYEQGPSGAPASAAGQELGEAPRVTASRFRNPSLTIPQGTVIQAVLETALDSTRAGGVRALGQRDVSGFDGTRVLIPRGSRLYGEYEANLQPGQNRALVQWSRLIRPDGVTVNLDSPSSDPLGRAGIRGKVDSKFLQRFGNAILQSVVDLGINIAVAEATDGVILALPGSTQNVQVANQQAFQPSLKVKHGASVSVFVAQDLDFSTVES